MAWNYDPTDVDFNETGGGASARNAVRLLSMDTDTNRQLLSDEEIDAVLATSANVWAAAIIIAEIVTNNAVKRRKVGRTEIEFYANRIPIWQTRADTHKKPEYKKTELRKPCYGPG